MKALSSSQKHVQYLENRDAERSKQLLAKDVQLANECESLSKLEGLVMCLSAYLQQRRAENGTYKDLLEKANTARALQNTVSRQRTSNYVNEPEKLVASNAAIDL